MIAILPQPIKPILKQEVILPRRSLRLRTKVNPRSVRFQETVLRRMTKVGLTPVSSERILREEMEPLAQGPFVEHVTWKRAIQKGLPKSKPRPLPPMRWSVSSLPEWRCELGFLSDRATNLLEQMNKPITKESLFRVMVRISQKRKEILTVAELQEIYAAIAIDELTRKYSIKNGAVLEKVKECVSVPLLISCSKALLSTVPASQNAISKITLLPDSRVQLIYNRTSKEAIRAHIERMERFQSVWHSLFLKARKWLLGGI